MKIIKIGVWGQFGGEKAADGQSIKTRSIYDLLKDYYGNDNIIISSTYNWKKRPFRFFLQTIKLYFKCKNVFILPANNGLKIISRIYNFLSFFAKRNIIYIVVGGSLPIFLNKNKKYIRYIKKYTVILAESYKQVEELRTLGLKNVEHFPNFKNIEPIKKLNNLTDVNLNSLCFFSRVAYDKGVEDAIEAARILQEKKDFKLDIYGKIALDYEKKFGELLKVHQKYVFYKGIVEFDKTVEVLKTYLCMLFPTFYPGEAQPGVIIDSYLSALPVIGTDWRFNSEFIIDGFNGFLVPVNNVDEIVAKVMFLYSNQEKMLQMRNNALSLSKDYDPKIIIKKLSKYIQ